MELCTRGSQLATHKHTHPKKKSHSFFPFKYRMDIVFFFLPWQSVHCNTLHHCRLSASLPLAPGRSGFPILSVSLSNGNSVQSCVEGKPKNIITKPKKKKDIYILYIKEKDDTLTQT